MTWIPADVWVDQVERRRLDEDDSAGYCTPGCPDDVCRSMGGCAWRPAGERRRLAVVEDGGK